MKKLFNLVVTLAGMLFYACSNELQVSPSMPDSNEEVVSSDFRSLDEAIAIANKSVSMLGDGTRGVMDRTVDKSKVFAVKNKGTRTSSENAFNHDTLMYAINFEDGNGYAIVSANRATEALIAVTESGSYSPEEGSENEGLNYYMENAAKYVSSSVTKPLPFLKERDTIATRQQTGTPLDTKWGQTGYFGRFAPNSLSGCFPLAVMEIMSYHNFPSAMTLHYLGNNDCTININWTDIKKHKLHKGTCSSIHESSCNASSDAHTNISHIAREIGYEANSVYYENATTTFDQYLVTCVNGFGFTNAQIKDYEPGCTTTYLSQGHPMIFLGKTTDVGHAWIVDAYINEHLTITDRSGLNIGESARTYETDRIYNHYNWGWNGIDNGYYLDSVFDVSKYDQLDSSKKQYVETGYNFNKDNWYLIMWP